MPVTPEVIRLQPASRHHAPAILGLRDALAQWQIDSGFDQWSPGEYPIALVERQIDAGEWFVMLIDEHVAATVRLAWSDPQIWPGNDQAGYIHGLMVSRSLAGTGLGATLLAWAEQRILAAGKSLARLDAVAANPRLLAYYQSHGYQEAGVVSFEPQIGRKDTMRLEKLLDGNA